MLKGFGTTQAERRVNLVPEVSGKIVYTLKDLKPGRRMKRGTTLMRIESSIYRYEVERLKVQIASLKKQIKLASRALKLSQKDWARNKRLLKRRALDRSSVERFEIGLSEREQRLENLKQNLKVTEIALKRARLNLRRTRLSAPFDARVSQGEAIPGNFVAAGRSILTLESTEAVELPVAFTLEQLRKVVGSDGAAVDPTQIPKALETMPPVKVWTSNERGGAWEGRVVRVGSRLDVSTRTLNLWVRVQLKASRKRKQAKAQRTLLPGSFCTVRIPVRKLSSAVTLPRKALYDDHVFVVNGSNGKARLEKRKVGLAYLDGQQIIVTSGLRDGDQVVINQLSDPAEGTPVTIAGN